MTMNDHRFNSYDDFLRAVKESKAEYEKKRHQLSWEEKLELLVKLQEKARFAGKLNVPPWPIGKSTKAKKASR